MNGQAENVKSVLKFNDYFVNNIEFNRNRSFREAPVKIDFDIKREIIFKDNKKILVTLMTRIFPNAEENNYPFEMNLSVTGVFEFEECGSDTAKALAEINAVAILFPYIRALITTYSSNANVTPVILPPINVVKLINENIKAD